MYRLSSLGDLVLLAVPHAGLDNKHCYRLLYRLQPALKIKSGGESY